MSENKREEPKGLGLIWGAEAIAVEIGRTRRQTFHLLETGAIPARRVGGRWCASRAALEAHFAGGDDARTG